MERGIENKTVVITRKTRLEELVERFGTKEQAKFYIEHSGSDFKDYQLEDFNYKTALSATKKTINDLNLKSQYLNREFLPNFVFNTNDIVVTLGQDGLVANTAKYLNGQVIIATNPDPERFDGVLLPFLTSDLKDVISDLFLGKIPTKSITMAQAKLADGQTLLAFNDLFIGAKSHTSARYKITANNISEKQSSSGIIVSTGVGSTGWLSSLFNMSHSVKQLVETRQKSVIPSIAPSIQMEWDSNKLIFVVREPFLSKSSNINLSSGYINQNQELIIESNMPENGVIFSDGIESDYLKFNSGSKVHISASKKRTILAHG